MSGEREVAWRELGVMAADLRLEVGWSTATGRAFIRLEDGTLVWAHVGDEKLPSWEPGAIPIWRARMAAWYAANPVQDETLEERIRNMPDPPGWQQDRYLERHPR